MDYNEVIENLKYLISEDCTDTQFDYVDEIKFAIKAIENQEKLRSKIDAVIGKMEEYGNLTRSIIDTCDEVEKENQELRSRMDKAITEIKGMKTYEELDGVHLYKDDVLEILERSMKGE